MRRREVSDRRQPRFVNVYGTEGYEPKFYLHMFQEDAAMGIMPFRSDLSRHPNLSIRVSTPDKLKSQALELLGSIEGEEWYQEGEIVRAAIERIAQLLVLGGRIHFEIVPGEKELGPVVHDFSERRVFRVPFGFVQLVPRAQRRYAERRCAWLGADAVWTVVLPDALGGWRQHRRMLRVLGSIEGTGPDFLRRDLERREWPAAYDPKLYHRRVKLAVFRATRIWGWIARDWQDEDTTEYYRFDRAITQHWAKAVLRTHIIAEINAFLARVLPNCRIDVEGLISPEEILTIQQKMRRGEIDFKAAMAAVDPMRT